MSTIDPAISRNSDTSSDPVHRDMGYHPGMDQSKPSQNVADIERALSVAIGVAVVAQGLSRLSIPAILVAGIGAALINRGISGHCSVYQKLGVNTAENQ